MSTAPFGAPGFGNLSFDPSQWFAGFAQAAQPRPPDPFAWLRPAPAPAAAMDPSALASQWMGQIQQLAAQFAGREAAPADIVGSWRTMLGENPFASTMAASAFMPPPLFGGTDGGRGPLEMPAFGYMREHQERMQDAARAGVEFQQASQAFQSIVAEAGQEAFSRFESLLAQRTGEAKPVESSRALFDLWIDAAEDAYADTALSERFQKAFGNYVNAQMRVRAAMQAEVERASAQWGIPGREEVDAAHRRIAELQRELRRLRRQVESTAAAQAPKQAASTSAEPAKAKPKADAKPKGGAATKKTTRKG